MSEIKWPDETCSVITCDNKAEYECPRCELLLCEDDADEPEDPDLKGKGRLCPLCMTRLEEL